VIESVEMWYPIANKKDTYIHVEAVAATTWTVVHNRDLLDPSHLIFTIYDDNKVIQQVSPHDMTKDQFQVTFGEAISGMVVCFFESDMFTPSLNAASIYTDQLLPKSGNTVQIGGHLVPTQTETWNLGSPTYKFKDLYLSAATLYLGDNTTLGGSTFDITVEGATDAADQPVMAASLFTAKPFTYNPGGGDITLNPEYRFEDASQNVYKLRLNLADGHFNLDTPTGQGTGILDLKSLNVSNDGNVAGVLAGKTTLSNSSGNALEITDGNADFYGDLKVRGTLDAAIVNKSSVNEMDVGDQYITLNALVTTGAPTLDAAIRVSRGDENDAIFGWDETLDRIVAGVDGSEQPVVLNNDTRLSESQTHIADSNNPHTVTKNQIGLGVVQNIKSKFDSTIDPTVNNDFSGGYAVGSLWVNTTTDESFMCMDSSVGAAVWKNTSTSEDLVSHLGDTNNPHGVTRDQLGVGVSQSPTFADVTVSNLITGGQVDGRDVSVDGTKLDTVDTNANNYTHPANHSPSVITQDASNRFVSDAEKATWTGKQDALGFTPIDAATKDAANGVCPLDSNSQVPSANLPALAVDNVSVVADETAQLALTVQEGDVAKRTDNGRTYFALNSTNASMADWAEVTASGDVLTVDGQDGVVDLSGSYEPKNANIQAAVTKADANETAISAHGADTANPHSVTKAQVGLGNLDNTKSNSTTSDPSANDDSSGGYSIGSRWYNTSTKDEFVCLDASVGTAVWKSTLDQNESLSVSAPQTPSAGNTVTVDKAVMLLSSAGGEVTLGDPQLTAGNNGQHVIIVGTSNTDYTKLTNGTGLVLKGDALLKEGNVLELIYLSSLSGWVETNRNVSLFGS